MTFPQVLDSTAVCSYRACGEQFKYAHLLPIRLKGESIDLIAGAAFAAGLEAARRAWYEQGIRDSDECLAAGVVALTKEFGNPTIPEKKRNKDWPRLVAGLESYFTEWPLASDPFRVANIHGRYAIEFTFAIPLPLNNPDTGDPILYAGRCDWFGQRVGSSGLWCVDDKTTSSFPTNWADQWQLRNQFFGYMLAARKYGLEVVGTIVRGTCLQLTQTKHLQAVVTGDTWKLNRWYSQLLRTVQKMIDDYKAGDFDFNFSDSCTAYGGCPFTRLCTSKDPSPWIKIDYQPNTWNPLHTKPTATVGKEELCQPS